MDEQSLGECIDALIVSDIKNWYHKEILFQKKEKSSEKISTAIVDAFQANKKRNFMITEINRILHNGPKFHYRNYHNY